MQIDKNIRPFIVDEEELIINALQKISDNQSNIVFSVSENGYLKGVVTDGDFRRWLLSQSSINLRKPISEVHNINFKFAYINDKPDIIEKLFKKNILFIPLVDHQNRIVAIARKKSQALKIGNYIIGNGHPVFIIAEIGNNHNGNMKIAKQLVDEAIAAGANCVKFQMRDLSTLYRNEGNANDKSEDLGSQYTLDLLSRFQLSVNEMFHIFDYSKEKLIEPLCTPWDIASFKKLETYKMQAYKVASADITNHDLLNELINTKKTLICSTGMSTEEEIKKLISLIKPSGTPYALLHCNSTYPAPFKDINLSYMNKLKKMGNCPVGYSGHERGIAIAIAAASMGAKIIEKHFTLDRNMEGNDHKVSLLPDEFKQMVQSIREVEMALGEGQTRYISQGEMMNRETLGKSLVINCSLPKGNIISEEMIDVKSPGQGLVPYRKNELIGKKALRDFKPGDFFYISDIENKQIKPRKYQFNRPWGIPIRYHDLSTLLPLSNPDIIEFHFSYKDISIDVDRFFLNKTYGLSFTVHSPELFSGDHILDLCTPDFEYRQQSIKELQKVINLTRKLNNYFPDTQMPKIIVNVGGSSQNGFISQNKKKEMIDLLSNSLSKLDANEVELIPQTMPPFPWHFGGQRFHNLFVDPDEIKSFCDANSYRICFDISHSYLACNHFQWSFKQFIEKVGGITAHLHISDSRGIDGEGLQVGEGEIDFPALSEWLSRYAPGVSFIPEIWQGHKNNGEGFWIALNYLEKWFKG